MGHHQLLFGGNFTPSSLSGLEAWYDFADVATLWKDTARTSAVTADTDIIKGVTDKSGGGKHLSEATNGPAYKTAIQNGKSVARFDGVNDQLANTAMSTDTSRTIIIASKKRSAAGASQTLFSSSASTAALFVSSTYAGGWAYYSGDPAGPGVIPFGGVPTTANVIVLRVNSAASMDGIALDTGQVINFDPNSDITTTTTFLYGVYGGGGQWMDADLYEVIIVNRALTDAEINQVGQYLAGKWGITVVPIFSPTSVSGLVAWYDFFSPGSLWKDTARTVSVGVDADVILGVTDKSGAGNHLSEATNGPAYKVNIQNGKGVARFDGTNDVLTTTIATFATATVFAIVVPRALSISARYRVATTDVAGPDLEIWDISGNNVFRAGTYNQFTVGSFQAPTFDPTTAVVGTPDVLAMKYDGSEVWLLRNGTKTTSTYAGGNFSTSSTLCIGHLNGGQFLNGDIGEVLVFNSGLSVANINLIGNYLATKWGTTWTTVT